ncbi:MAG: hypothetical protein IJ578_03450 [Bacteroidales bacterium]|nr:hypothetical protein [Bacteroidales bacterium]
MKVKFSKFAALLLGGAALVAVSCNNTDYDDDIKDLQKKVTALETGKVASLESQVSILQSAVSALESARTAIEGDISDMDAQITDINADIALMKQNIDKKLDTETFQAFAATTVEDITGLDTRVGTLENQVGELGSALNDFKAQVARDYLSNAAFETWQTNVLAQKLAEVKAYAEAQDAALKAELKKYSDDNDAALKTALEAKIAANASRITDAEEDIAALQALTESMNTKLTKAISDIEVLDGKIGKLDEKIVSEIDKLRTEINNKIAEIDKRLTAAEVDIEKLLNRIQSIVYVPDYEDGKMTVNYSEMTQGDGAGQTPVTMLIGQATEATFKVSPADAAAELAAVGTEIFSFDTKAVKTRGGETAAPQLEIVDVKKGSVAGEIVVTFLPKNFDLQAFGYSDLQPVGSVPVGDSQNPENVAYYYNKADLEHYKVRAAYATALEINYKAEMDEESDIARDIEISSPFVTLYPSHDASADITVLPDPYVYNAERKDWQVADAAAEIAWNDKGTVITMFENAVVLYQMGEKKYTYEELAEQKYALPAVSKKFDVKVTYNPANDDKLMKEAANEAGYATVKMNEEKSYSQLKAALGRKATGAYSFYTGMGDKTIKADFVVTVTKPIAEFKLVTDDFVWTYAQDAKTDHDLFNGQTAAYGRVKVPVSFAADSKNLPGDEKYGLKVSDLKRAVPTEWTVYNEKNEKVEGISIYPIIEGENLFANVSGFAWDKTYTAKATYETMDNIIKVEFIFKTVDRSRKPVQVTVTPDCTFIINDPATGYDAQTGTYYAKSEPLAASIKAAFEAAGVTKTADFANADAFAAAELTGKFKAASKPGDIAYLNVAQDVFLETKPNGKNLTAKQLLEIAALERALQRNVTTYIGQEVQLVWKVGYEVPAYNFKHVEEFVGKDNVFFTQVQPKYWANASSVDGGRSKLYKYDVEKIDFMKRAWNVVDAKGNVVEDLAAAGLTVKFGYSDETLGAKALPNPADGRATYDDLWNADNTLYFMTNLPAIGIRADLSIESGSGDGKASFPIKTRFDGVGTPDDYSKYEVRRYTPFIFNKPGNITVKVVDQKVYEQDLLEGIKIQDIRPGIETKYTVLENGKWTIGNSFTDSRNNGFAANRSAADAYDIQQTLVAEPESLSPSVKDLFTIEGNTLKFNYTGEVKLQKPVTYDVTVTVKTKWQEDITFNYQVIFTPGN